MEFKKLLASGSEAQVWHLNVHSDGRADGRTDGRADGRTDGRADGRTDGRADGRAGGRWSGAGQAYGGPESHEGCRGLRRSGNGSVHRGLWGVGGQAARRGVAGGGGPFFHEFRRGALISPAFREFAPRCEPHPARAKCGPMIRMSSGSAKKNERGPDAGSAVTASTGVQHSLMASAPHTILRGCSSTLCVRTRHTNRVDLSSTRAAGKAPSASWVGRGGSYPCASRPSRGSAPLRSQGGSKGAAKAAPPPPSHTWCCFPLSCKQGGEQARLTDETQGSQWSQGPQGSQGYWRGRGADETLLALGGVGFDPSLKSRPTPEKPHFRSPHTRAGRGRRGKGDTREGMRPLFLVFVLFVGDPHDSPSALRSFQRRHRTRQNPPSEATDQSHKGSAGTSTHLPRPVFWMRPPGVGQALATLLLVVHKDGVAFVGAAHAWALLLQQECLLPRPAAQSAARHPPES
eukprot:gene22852-biopygen10287